MHPRLVISDYNRDAYQHVMARAILGPRRPLLLAGPPGIGKSLLLDGLQRRAAPSPAPGEILRMTAEQWIAHATRDLQTFSQSLVNPLDGPALVLLDNVEILAGKPRTQQCLAEAIIGSTGSAVLVTNSELPALAPLIDGLAPCDPEVVKVMPPPAGELRRIACVLALDPCNRRHLDLVDGATNPGEVMGLITQAVTRRALTGGASS